MDKKELEKTICEMSKKAEADRKKREYVVIAVFAIVFFALYCLFEKMPENFGDAVGVLISSIALSALHCAINHTIFSYLFEKDEAAQRAIKLLREKLIDIEHNEFDELINKYTRKR